MTRLGRVGGGGARTYAGLPPGETGRCVRNGWGGRLGERDAVYCIPERLWCYPRAPAVQDLEQFVFPKQVPVRLERHAAWRRLTRHNLAADEQQESIQSVSERILVRRPPFFEEGEEASPPAAQDAALNPAGVDGVGGEQGGQGGGSWGAKRTARHKEEPGLPSPMTPPHRYIGVLPAQ